MGSVLRIEAGLRAGKHRRCKDCHPASKRLAPHPGPRCATHHREIRRQRANAAHERQIMRTYRGVGPGDYERIVALSHGACQVCGRIHGTRKRRLPLEHDHKLNWPRGVVCDPVNDFIAYIRDDPEIADRLAEYLRNPPAWHVVGPPPEEER